MPKLKKKKPVMKKKSSVKKTSVKKTSAKKSTKKGVKKAAVKRKSTKVSAIPKGYNIITPYLIMDQAARAIEFYKKVFGAKEKLRMERAGKVGHAELQFGDTKIMLADACPEMNAHAPEKFGGSPIGIHLYIKNVDAIVDRAIAAGATLERPAEDMFYGDRNATVIDPFGHRWTVSTHVENVTPAKMKKRAKEFFGNK